MSKQLGFYVDTERCVDCRACEVACKQWNNVSIGPRWRRVTTVEGGEYPRPYRYTVSLACNHCARPRPAWPPAPYPGLSSSVRRMAWW